MVDSWHVSMMKYWIGFAAALLLMSCSDTPSKGFGFEQDTEDMSKGNFDMADTTDMADLPGTPDIGVQDLGNDASIEPDLDSPDLPVDPNVGPISITSWNIVCLRDTPEAAFCNSDGFGGNFVRGPNEIAALASHASAVGTDIFLLQEIENTVAVENILPGWNITTVGTAALNQAIAINPATDIELLGISSVVDLAVTNSARQGLHAVIKHDQTQVHILGVHLKSGCARDPLQSQDFDCQILREQLRVIQGWIEDREARNQPYMIVGDFNRVLGNNDDFLQGLNAVATGGLHITTTGLRPTCWDHVAGAPSYNSFIDHHVLSDDLVALWGQPTLSIYNYTETYLDAWEYISDHCPVTAVFVGDR